MEVSLWNFPLEFSHWKSPFGSLLLEFSHWDHSFGFFLLTILPLNFSFWNCPISLVRTFGFFALELFSLKFSHWTSPNSPFGMFHVLVHGCVLRIVALVLHVGSSAFVRPYSCLFFAGYIKGILLWFPSALLQIPGRSRAVESKMGWSCASYVEQSHFSH